MYQERYWKELYQLRVHVNYTEIYLGKSEITDRNLNIFLAATSSSSICGWAVWQEYSFIWALIIASSQFLNAIKTFLPFKRRKKSLSGLLHELEELLIFAEMRWYDVSEGKLTEEEIHKLQFQIRSRKTKSLKKYFPNQTLPEKMEYFDIAEQRAQTYIKNFYS